MGCAKLKPPRRRCPNLKIVILPDFHALHPPRRAAHSSYAIKAPAAGAATRAARASLPGPWAVCMLLWARPRSPIADPLLYLGPCRPHLPSPRYFADFPPMLRSYPLRARSAGPPRPRFRSYCGGRLRDAVKDNSRVSLLHAPGGGRGLRDAYARVLVRRHVAWKLVQCLCAREASSPGSLKPGMGGS